jgi:hypothetical protein
MLSAALAVAPSTGTTETQAVSRSPTANPTVSAEGAVTWTIPLQVTVALGGIAPTQIARDVAPRHSVPVPVNQVVA